MNDFGAGVTTAVQDGESDMAGFQERGKTIMLWSDLIRSVEALVLLLLFLFQKDQFVMITKMTLG